MRKSCNVVKEYNYVHVCLYFPIITSTSYLCHALYVVAMVHVVNLYNTLLIVVKDHWVEAYIQYM